MYEVFSTDWVFSEICMLHMASELVFFFKISWLFCVLQKYVFSWLPVNVCQVLLHPTVFYFGSSFMANCSLILFCLFKLYWHCCDEVLTCEDRSRLVSVKYICYAWLLSILYIFQIFLFKSTLSFLLWCTWLIFRSLFFELNVVLNVIFYNVYLENIIVYHYNRC